MAIPDDTPYGNGQCEEGRVKMLNAEWNMGCRGVAVSEVW